MVRGSLLIAAATLKTPTRNGYIAQGVNLTFSVSFYQGEVTDLPQTTMSDVDWCVAFFDSRFPVSLNQGDMTTSRRRPLSCPHLDPVSLNQGEVTDLPQTTMSDVDFIIGECNRVCTEPIDYSHVKAAWCGLRPLVQFISLYM